MRSPWERACERADESARDSLFRTIRQYKLWHDHGLYWSIPFTWVTDYSDDMGNASAAKRTAAVRTAKICVNEAGTWRSARVGHGQKEVFQEIRS